MNSADIRISKPVRGFILAIAVLLSGNLAGQDIHFSQFSFSPLQLSPALTGVFNGNMRFTGTYRSQWHAVPVPYMTFAGTAELNHYDSKQENSLFGGGMMFYYDQAGEGNLSWANLSLSGSYTRRMSEKDFLTAGLMTSFSQRAFDMNALSFDSQFDGEIFNPALSTGEDIMDDRIFVADFSVGLNWHHQFPQKHFKMDVGTALFHINQPETSFNNNSSVKLRSRLSTYVIGETRVGEEVDFLFNAMGQLQGPYREFVVGLAGRFQINQTDSRELAFAIGANYRIKDAIIPNINVDYLVWRLGLSYDINLNNFTEATDYRGGPEISLIYFYRKVPSLDAQKICPIF